MQIESDRLVIRDFQENDTEAFFNLAKNEEVTRYLYWGPFNHEESRQYVLRAIKLSARKRVRKYILAVSLKDGTLIGSVFLYITKYNQHIAEITYWLDPVYWGKGYGSEALQITLKWAFQELHIHRIFARVDQTNTRSVELLKRNHFIQEGVLRQDILIKSEWRDSVIFSLLENEFVSP